MTTWAGPTAAAVPLASAERIRALDGLRGVAIVLVILYHAYSRWADRMPGGARFHDLPVLANGWLGVELFFLISGFVILMTLQRCRSFPEFLLRRWFRLFPASLIVGLFILATAAALPERPLNDPSAIDLLPSVTFIHPHWLAALSGLRIGPLDGAYWSLFVEFQFYVVFGLLFFLVGELPAVALMSAAFLAAWIGRHFSFGCAAFVTSGERINLLYWGWLMVGALAYLWISTRRSVFLFAALGLSLACPSAVMHGEAGRSALLLAAALIALFLLALRTQAVAALLSHPALLFIGFISYPLYLIHQGTLVALTIRLGHAAPWVPPVLLPLPGVLAVIGLAWIVARYLEPAAARALRPLFERARRRLAAPGGWTRLAPGGGAGDGA